MYFGGGSGDFDVFLVWKIDKNKRFLIKTRILEQIFEKK